MSDEDCIRLCNSVDANPWMCIKHTMDDNGVRAMANLIKNNMESGRKCYIEYSNETWNSANPFYIQMYYCFDIAVAHNLIPSGKSTANEGDHMFIAAWGHLYRLMQIWRIFEEVFGADFENKIVKVVPSMLMAMYTGNMMVGLDDERINPRGYIADAFAIAPYLGETYTNMTDAMAMANNAGGMAAPHRIAVRNYNTAHNTNAVLIAYEGGPGFMNNTNAFNSNPQAADVYKAYLNSIGPYLDLFVAYTYVHGYWGHKGAIGQSNSEAHKYRGLVEWGAAHPYTEAPVAVSAPVLAQPAAGHQPAAAARITDLRGRVPAAQAAGRGIYLRTGSDGVRRMNCVME